MPENRQVIRTDFAAGLSFTAAYFADLAITNVHVLVDNLTTALLAADSADGTTIGAGQITPGKEIVSILEAGPILFTVDCPAGVQDYALFDANAPFQFRIIKAWVVCTAANAAGTVQLRTATGGVGNAITVTAFACAVNTAVVQNTDLDPARYLIALNGSVWVRKNAAADSGRVFVLGIRV